MPGFPAGPFFFGGGGDSPQKISYSPPKFLLTLFLIILSPPTTTLLPPPPKSFNPPPKKVKSCRKPWMLFGEDAVRSTNRDVVICPVRVICSLIFFVLFVQFRWQIYCIFPKGHVVGAEVSVQNNDCLQYIKRAALKKNNLHLYTNDMQVQQQDQ